MDRKNFGKLIISLRLENIDLRDTPWSRQKFAKEANIYPEILSNIEIGRRTTIQPDLLISMANALKLTSAERREFFMAAADIDEELTYHKTETPKKALEDLLAMMGKLRQPALIVDPYFDIVAINQMSMDGYRINPGSFSNSAANPAISCNLMRFLFSSEFNAQKAAFGAHKEKLDANIVSLFRAASLRYRTTKYFENLYPQLLELSEFKSHIHRKRQWPEEHYTDNIFFYLKHPQMGEIRVASMSVSASSTAGELRLFIFTALSDESVKIFANLTKHENYIFQPLPKWPQKDELAKK